MKNRNKDISEVLPSGSWKGRRCFLIGGGPSLETFNPDLLQGELVIGTNKAFLKFDSTINYAMDMKFLNYVTKPPVNGKLERIIRERWELYSGIKLFLQVVPKFDFSDSIMVVKRLLIKQISLDISKGIFSGTNSGFGALMLAIALGATEIGLVGYDLKVDLDRERTHWHDGYPNQTPRSLQRKLDRYRMELEDFAPLIRNLGIQVFDISPNGALTCFPKKSLEEMLGDNNS